MKELVLVEPFFRLLLEGMLDSHLLLMPPKITAGVETITNEKALIVGRMPDKSLKGKKTVEAGVDTWIVSNKVLIEFNNLYAFFLPMCIVVGRYKLTHSLWGMVFRVYFGAFLSLSDFATDINTI